MRLLVAGLSARSMAQAATAAGFDCIGADCFGDADTRAMCSQWHDIAHHGQTLPSLDFEKFLHLAASGCADYCVLGAGFEPHVDALDQIAMPMAGSQPSTWRTCRNPFVMAAAAPLNGLMMPPMCASNSDWHEQFAPAHVGRWLVKSANGSGARHVRPAEWPLTVNPNEYLQQRVAGDAVSMTCLVTPQGVTVLGVNAQRFANIGGNGGQVFVGVTSGYQFNAGVLDKVAGSVARLLRATGVLGVCSVDLMVNGAQCYLLEVNPRWSASADLYDAARLIAAHISYQALAPEQTAPTDTDHGGLRIVYSSASMAWSEELAEFDWITDVPAPCQAFMPGQPICTVHARGANPESVEARLRQREQQVLMTCAKEVT